MLDHQKKQKQQQQQIISSDVSSTEEDEEQLNYKANCQYSCGHSHPFADAYAMNENCGDSGDGDGSSGSDVQFHQSSGNFSHFNA